MVQQWLLQNLLTFNLSKTKYMCYSIYDSNLPNFQSIHTHSYLCLMNDKNDCHCSNLLNSTNSIKYLGVTMGFLHIFFELVNEIFMNQQIILQNIFPLTLLQVH